MSELGRRLVHASGSLVPLSYLVGVPWVVVRWVVVLGAVAALVLEALRLTGTVEWWLFDRLTRDYEWESIAGYAWYGIGFAIAAWAFDPPIAVAAMLMLSLGDPVSGFLSRGEVGVKRSYVLLATFGVTLAIASVLGIALGPAVAGALAATLADGVTLKIGTRYVDDNLTIPVAAAVAMWGAGVF